MSRKCILVFAILALVAGIAGTRPAPGSLTVKVNLLQPSVVRDTELKAGQYRDSLENEKLTIENGKTSVETPAKVESTDRKHDMTAIRYVNRDGKAFISEIRVGGTKTRIILNQ